MARVVVLLGGKLTFERLYLNTLTSQDAACFRFNHRQL